MYVDLGCSISFTIYLCLTKSVSHSDLLH